MEIQVLISILILVIGLVLGMPIPFAFGGAFLWITYTLHFSPNTLLASGYTQINSTVLLAIPLFVLAGKVMEKGQIGDALIGLVERFVGRIKSGLGAVAGHHQRGVWLHFRQCLCYPVLHRRADGTPDDQGRVIPRDTRQPCWRRHVLWGCSSPPARPRSCMPGPAAPRCWPALPLPSCPALSW